VGWVEEEVEEWIASRIALRDLCCSIAQQAERDGEFELRDGKESVGDGDNQKSPLPGSLPRILQSDSSVRSRPSDGTA